MSRSRALAVRLAAALLLLLILLPPAHPAAAGEAFSFIALGDTRQHYYLPGGESDQAVLLDVFPKKKKYARVRFFFDPVSGQLAWARLTPGRGGPAMTITYRDGWPQVMRQQVPGRGLMVTMRAAGRRWVFDQVVGAIIDGARKPGGPGFVLHTGDVVVWGGQGASLVASPYWQRFKSELLDRLPPATPKLGLPGRLFLALGNHELVDDPGVMGAVTTLPGLAKLGFSSQRRIYSFTHKGCRFIFLDTGRRSKGDWWRACCPPRKEQLAQLVKWLDQAVAEKARQVFVAFHVPVFCLGGRGGMPRAQSPHPILKRYAQRLSITVFNGDVHTTEAYLVDGVRYLVLGGGGAPQKLAQPRPRPGYPRELYWRGAPRVEEYNYAMVKVDDHGLSIDLHRFRPTQPQHPCALVRVFPPPPHRGAPPPPQ